MTSSRDPGALGFYGFRNRTDHSYDVLAFADSRAVQVPRVGTSSRRAGGQVDRPRRAADLPCLAGQRRHGLVLPHPRHRPSSTPTRPAQGRDRGARRRVPASTSRTSGRRTRSGCSRDIEDDDRAALPGRRAPARDAAVGPLLHGRDGHRPHAPRLLALHRSEHRLLRARQPASRRDARLLPRVDEQLGAPARAAPTTTRRCWSSPTTARSGWTAASA